MKSPYNSYWLLRVHDVYMYVCASLVAKGLINSHGVCLIDPK